MVRGVIAGLGAGAVVAAVGIGALSVMTPLPRAPGAEVASAPSVGAPVPGTALPAGTAAAPQEGHSAPPAMPLPKGTTTGEGAAGGPQMDAGLVSPTPQGSADNAPAVPADDSQPQAVAAVPALPSVAASLPGTATPGPAAGTETETAPRPDAAPTPAVPEAPAPGGALTTPQPDRAIPVPPPGEVATPDLPAPDLPSTEANDATVPATTAPDGDIMLMPDGVSVPPAQRLPRVFSPGADGNGGLSNAPGTVVNRLPTIPQPGGEGEAPLAPETAPEAAPDDASAGLPQMPAVPSPQFQHPPGAAGEAQPDAPDAAASGQDAGPAIRRYAASVATTANTTPLAVVLIDVGVEAGGLDPETIKALGIPVTIAIDPTRPGAANAARIYRAAGLEVATLASALPPGATPQDVAVAMEGWHSTLPEAIAVIEPPKPVFQNDRMLSQQVIAGLKQSGEGLVTQATGLDSAAQLAKGAGVPQVQVWRVLDAQRENGAVIARALNRAVFEASRKGGLAVMLSAWPESVAGLTDWAGGLPPSVALVPVSALALGPGKGAR